MTPWQCPPLSENDTPATGGANQYLELLSFEDTPQGQDACLWQSITYRYRGILLAGLFALYAMYQCNAFDRAARRWCQVRFGFRIFGNLLQNTICCVNPTGYIFPSVTKKKDEASAVEKQCRTIRKPLRSITDSLG